MNATLVAQQSLEEAEFIADYLEYHSERKSIFWAHNHFRQRVFRLGFLGEKGNVFTEAWWCNFEDHFGHHFRDHFGDRRRSDRQSDLRSATSEIMSKMAFRRSLRRSLRR